MELIKSSFIIIIIFSVEKEHKHPSLSVSYLLGECSQINLSSLTWEHIYFYFMNSTSTKKKLSDADSAHKATFYTCQAAYRFL